MSTVIDDLEFEEEKSSIQKKQKIIIGLICAIAAILIIVIIILMTHNRTYSNIAEEEINDYSKLPRLLYANDSYILPPKDMGIRTISLYFQILSVLESQYKKNGIEKGFLKKNQSVSLSVDGFITSLQSSGIQLSTFSDFLKFYQSNTDSIYKFFFPEAACPYSDEEPNCGDLSSLGKKNPISFTINNFTYESGIQRIKSLFNITRRPLAFSIPIPISSYLISCDDPLISTFPDLEKDEICFENTESYYGQVTYYPFSFNPSITVTELNNLDAGELYHFVLYGYNDDFIGPQLQTLTSDYQVMKGGFIVKNFEGNKGHSLEYLSGQITPQQESSICPSPNDPFSWTPVTLECLENYLDPSKCSTSFIKPVNNEWEIGGTTLICTDTTGSICEQSGNYALLLDTKSSRNTIDLTVLSNGMIAPKIAHFSNEGVEVIQLNVPFEHLDEFFAVDTENQFENSDRCGYNFLYYDVVKKVIQRSRLDSGGWGVYDIDVNWNKGSYASLKHGSYKLLINSTEEYESLPTLEQPFKFDL